jgi:hypothetical protein
VDIFFFSFSPNLNILQTGADTATLTNIEAQIQAKFQNGLLLHLLPSVKNVTYTPGPNQSQIFVTSHSNYLRLHTREIQNILHERLILVHGNVFDYAYRWNLESFGWLHDVDKTVDVHGKTGFSSV